MDKVKLTHDEAYAMKVFMGLQANNEAAIKEYLKHSDGWFSAFLPLKEMGFDKFAQCLFFGYESELTKEERLLNYYLALPVQVHHRAVVVTTLNILGIQIKGIN